MTILIPIAVIAGILVWVLRPQKGTIKTRRASILTTAIPPVIVAIAALVFQLLHNATGNAGVSDISNTCFIVDLGLIGAAILALAGFALARKGEVAKGIGFGLCIAFVLSIHRIWFIGVVSRSLASTRVNTYIRM